MARTNTFIKQKPTPSSQEEYIASLDPLLRRNKGGSTLFGYETSNRPFTVPEGSKVQNPSGLQGGFTEQLTDYSGFLPQQSPVGQGREYKTDSISFIKRLSQSAQPQPQQQMADGGILYSDNIVRYADGSTMLPDGTRTQPIYGIQQLRSGNILMSDGSIKTPNQLQQTGDVLTDIQNMFFGQNFPITQAYGNYNPNLEPGSGYNLGTDIGASYQQINAPFSGRVVEVFRDDGTRWGDRSGHQGYGNSILIQLDTGEYLRFSHLQDQPQYIEGDLINPGDVIGVTGATGNVTGPHLDLEYYNAQGQIDSPENMIALSNPQVASQLVKSPEENIPEEDKRARDEYLRSSGALQSREASQEPQGEVLGTTTQQEQSFKPATNPITSAIDRANLTGTRYDAGLSEYLNNEPSLAREKQIQTISNIGQDIRAPELNTDTLARSQGTNPARQLLGNVADYAGTRARELGLDSTRVLGRDDLSERIAGGKTTNTDIFNDLKNTFIQPVNAQGQEINPSNNIGQTVNSSLIKDKILKTLDELKGSVLGDNTFRPTPPMETRAVGNELGTGDVLQSPAPTQSIQPTQSKVPTNTFSSPIKTASKSSSKSSGFSSSKSGKSSSKETQSKAPTQSIAPKPAKVTYTQSAVNQSPANVSYQSKVPTQSIAPKKAPVKTSTFQKAVSKALTFLKKLF